MVASRVLGLLNRKDRKDILYIIMLEGIFYGVEAGTVVVNPLYYQEDNGV